MRLYRATVFHTPRNPFEGEGALESLEDGALVIEGEQVVACGAYETLRRDYPQAEVSDMRGAYLLPGFVDTHVHYPQVPVIGAMGLRLLEWLEQRTLPAEAKLADLSYARETARTFLRQLAKNGTTTALVFGCHFAAAQEVFFEEAAASGLRITSGLVVSDRNLIPELHRTPQEALEDSLTLAARYHRQGRLQYAVTPRFSLSCTEGMLEVCGELLRGNPDLFFTSHVNENPSEIAFVAQLFPWAQDYLATYERFGLVNERSVYAHNVHVSDSELVRLGQARAGVCHCASSNAFIGSGLFPFKRHLQHGVKVSLGSDVGGGTGFSLLKEGLMAYQAQMLLPPGDGFSLTPAHLLYLATKAGALALGHDALGDFTTGAAADFIILRPPSGSTLFESLRHAPSPEAALGTLFTLAREDAVAETYVGGQPLRLHERVLDSA